MSNVQRVLPRGIRNQSLEINRFSDLHQPVSTTLFGCADNCCLQFFPFGLSGINNGSMGSEWNELIDSQFCQLLDHPLHAIALGRRCGDNDLTGILLLSEVSLLNRDHNFSSPGRVHDTDDRRSAAIEEMNLTADIQSQDMQRMVCFRAVKCGRSV